MIDKTIESVEKSKISGANKYYWKYQYELGKESISPYLSEHKCFKKGDRVCEIGSAEGGVLHSLIVDGAEYGLGTDIAESRIIAGAEISKAAELNVEYSLHNILSEEPKPEWVNSFDIAMLRDVIEHLDNTFLALKNISKILKPSGVLFITFPPYYSPYGGHQHTLAGNFFTKLPYIHLLPNFIFHRLIRSGRENDIGEVKRLQTIKLTAKKLKSAAEKAGYEIMNEDYYLLRPVFKMKFGLPTIKITALAKLPFIKDLFSLECAYILKKKG